VDILLSLEKNLQAVESDLMIMKNTDRGIIESQCRYDDGMYFFSRYIRSNAFSRCQRKDHIEDREKQKEKQMHRG
jgi:hypothetical protein